MCPVIRHYFTVSYWFEGISEVELKAKYNWQSFICTPVPIQPPGSYNIWFLIDNSWFTFEHHNVKSGLIQHQNFCTTQWPMVTDKWPSRQLNIKSRMLSRFQVYCCPVWLKVLQSQYKGQHGEQEQIMVDEG